MKIILTAFIFLMFCCQLNVACGQPISVFDEENIINGKLWTPVFSKAKGNPFFLDNRSLKGDLLFNGTWFKNQEYTYDNVKDEVIKSVVTRNGNKNILLNRFFLEGFNIMDSGKKYSFLRGDKIDGLLDTNKYYQVYRGKNIIYVIKWQKNKELFSVGYFEYVENNKLFLIINNELKKISSKKQLLRIFKERKREIKKFIQKNRLKISGKTPLDVIPVVKYFESL